MLTLAMVLLLQAPAPAPAESVLAIRLRSRMDTLAAGDWFSGVVTVTRNGRRLFAEARGLADREAQRPNRLDTRFNLASMNKMFTAVAIAQLAEAGRLSFDDPVGRHLPDWPNRVVRDQVTIRQLLSHTSGMGLYWGSPRYRETRERIRTVADYVALFAEDTLLAPPGDRFIYSNNGFVTLGAIVERVTGTSYYDYVADRILAPAGMTETGFPAVDERGPAFAVGYTVPGSTGRMPDMSRPAPAREPNRRSLPGRGGPAGGGYSTAADLERFAAALVSGRLVGKAWLERMWTPAARDPRMPPGVHYGLGFDLREAGDGSIATIGHNGGSPGVGVELIVWPRLGVTAVILSNTDPPGMFALDRTVRELVEALPPS